MVNYYYFVSLRDITWKFEKFLDKTIEESLINVVKSKNKAKYKYLKNCKEK